MHRKYTLSTATALVIANMVGTGVFGSLGYQLLSLHDYAAIIILWALGGVIALCGAFAYSELGAAFPRSGGEYNFLTEIFHPSVGFLSGWVSAIVGFSAPIAAAASLLGGYLGFRLLGFDTTPLAQATLTLFHHPFHYTVAYDQIIGAIVIVGVTIIQTVDYRIGGHFQSYATLLKILLIIFFVIAGFCVHPQPVSFIPSKETVSAIFSGGFAVSLVYVNFAYSGWNASSYVAGEVQKPARNIPLSIISGTALVTALYVLLNFIFLYVAPVSEMAGIKEASFVPAKHIFGDNGGRVVSLLISLILVSTISSMVLAGPRVLQRMGEDFSVFRIISTQNKHHIPATAIWFQSAVALVILFTSTFSDIIGYTTFVLTLFATLTVAGVIVLRLKKPEMVRPYQTFGYPFTSLFFIIANIWFLYFWIKSNTGPSLVGIGIVAVGLLVYFAAHNLSKPEGGKLA